MERVKAGIIGCGNISPAYLGNLVNGFSSVVQVRACADLIHERARSRADEFHIPRACTVEEVLSDHDIEVVVNLTVAAAHHEVTMAALDAGKHVFSEKPLAVTRAEGEEIVEKAASKGLRVGGASDTFLGAGLQTCRKLLDDGQIGTPITAGAFIALRYYSEKGHKIGVGPMFDMGPYYITALVALLGPVKRVTGSAQIPFPLKPHPKNSPDYGKSFKIETPTNVSGVLDFADGGVGVVTTTCECMGYHARLEVCGTDAVLVANDPNHYAGPVTLRSPGGDKQEVPLVEGFREKGRGLGVAEMAYAIRSGKPHRANGDLMFHVLDIMQAIHDASREGRHIELRSTCCRPEPFNLAVLSNAPE